MNNCNISNKTSRQQLFTLELTKFELALVMSGLLYLEQSRVDLAYSEIRKGNQTKADQYRRVAGSVLALSDKLAATFGEQ